MYSPNIDNSLPIGKVDDLGIVEDKVKEEGEIVPYYTDVDGNFYSFTRGEEEHITRREMSKGYYSLSDYFVNIILGKHNQDISCLVVGNKGAGKSATVLSLAYHCAVKISMFLNNGDDSLWPNYYNLHELTACILEEESNRLMNVQQKYVIKNFDDISLGWNSRSWRDESNTNKNDVFTINRTDNCIQFFSVPNQFLLDKVPRSLVSHYIEMDEKHFDQGFTTIKMFKPVTMFRQGKIINPYLSVDNKKYVAYAIPKPPQELWDGYNKLRERCKNIAVNERNESNKENKTKHEGTNEKRRSAWRAWLGRAAPLINEQLGQGVSPEKALYRVAMDQGQTRGAVSFLMRSGEFEKYGFVQQPNK